MSLEEYLDGFATGVVAGYPVRIPCRGLSGGSSFDEDGSIRSIGVTLYHRPVIGIFVGDPRKNEKLPPGTWSFLQGFVESRPAQGVAYPSNRIEDIVVSRNGGEITLVRIGVGDTEHELRVVDLSPHGYPPARFRCHISLETMRRFLDGSVDGIEREGPRFCRLYFRPTPTTGAQFDVTPAGVFVHELPGSYRALVDKLREYGFKD